jgi:replicative DNA helicase
MRVSEIAERALLGAILLDHTRLADVENWLEPADFYAYRHGLVYTEMLDLRRTGQEDPTARAVLDRLVPNAESRRLVDGPYLHTLMESCPHPSRAPLYGRMVLEASIHRRIADRAEHLGHVARSEAPPDVVIDELDREVVGWTAAIQALERRWTRAGGDAAADSTLDSGTLDMAPSHIAAEAAEVSVIASLLASPWQFGQVKGWLRPEDFSRADTRALYIAINKVVEAGQPVDVVTVMWAAIRQAGAADRLDHQAVARLAEAGVSGYAVVSGRAVLQASVRNQTAASARRVVSVAQQSRAHPTEVTRYARGQLSDVADGFQRWGTATA